MKVKVCLFTVLILLCSCSQVADYSDYDPDNIAHVNNGEGMDLTQFGKGTLYEGAATEGILNSSWHNILYDSETYRFFNYDYLITFNELCNTIYGNIGIQSPVICLYNTKNKTFVGTFNLRKVKNELVIYITLSKEMVLTVPENLSEEDLELVTKNQVEFYKKYPYKYVDIESVKKTFHYIVNEKNLILY